MSIGSHQITIGKNDNRFAENTMNLKDALVISDLARRVNDCGQIIEQMREQDKSGSRLLGPYYMSSELWPQPSADAAKRVRAILIEDFSTRRDEYIDQLKVLNVSVDEAK